MKFRPLSYWFGTQFLNFSILQFFNPHKLNKFHIPHSNSSAPKSVFTSTASTPLSSCKNFPMEAVLPWVRQTFSASVAVIAEISPSLVRVIGKHKSTIGRPSSPSSSHIHPARTNPGAVWTKLFHPRRTHRGWRSNNQ